RRGPRRARLTRHHVPGGGGRAAAASAGTALRGAAAGLGRISRDRRGLTGPEPQEDSFARWSPMGLPWWAWLLIAVYLAPGVYVAIALARMKPLPSLPEEGRRPWARWLRLGAFPVGVVAVLLLW